MEAEATGAERRIVLEAQDEAVRFAKGAVYGIVISSTIWIAILALWLI